MSYKIWVQIEEIDDTGEHKNNVTDDVEVGEYGSFDEAKKVMDKIIETA